VYEPYLNETHVLRNDKIVNNLFNREIGSDVLCVQNQTFTTKRELYGFDRILIGPNVDPDPNRAQGEVVLASIADVTFTVGNIYL
jgi:hypothetical protein